MNYKIIYHANCYDGFTAAWIAHRRLTQDVDEEQVELIPALYGEAAPKVTQQDTVYILDFSYPRAVLEELRSECYSLCVLDHHKTAEEALKGLPYCVFDMNRSGAGMAWDWFFEDEPRPYWVNCVEDRDLWRFKCPNTKDVHAALTSFPMTLENWDKIHRMWHEKLISRGEVVREYLDVYHHKLIEQRSIDSIYHPDEGGPIHWVFLNNPYQNCSEIMHLLLEEVPEAEIACTYYQRSDGKWQYSLRSREDGPDVSKVAKNFGGGGHVHAAGFESARLELDISTY